MKVVSHHNSPDPEQTSLPVDGGDKPPAWELIDVGRYRPRRTRGSYPGRELG